MIPVNDGQDGGLTLGELFGCFKQVSTRGLKVELVAEGGQTFKADYQLSLSAVNLCFKQ